MEGPSDDPKREVLRWILGLVVHECHLVKEGGSYSPRASTKYCDSDFADGQYRVDVNFEFAPDNVAATVAAALEEIERLRIIGPDAPVATEIEVGSESVAAILGIPSTPDRL